MNEQDWIKLFAKAKELKSDEQLATEARERLISDIKRWLRYTNR